MTAEKIVETIENSTYDHAFKIGLIENYGIRQKQIALSELQKEYGGYTEEIERCLKRINARLDELLMEIAGVEF